MVDWKARCIFLLFKCEKLQRRIDLLTSTKSTFYMDRHGGGYIAIGVPAAASMFTRGHTIYLGMPKEKASTA